MCRVVVWVWSLTLVVNVLVDTCLSLSVRNINRGDKCHMCHTVSSDTFNVWADQHFFSAFLKITYYVLFERILKYMLYVYSLKKWENLSDKYFRFLDLACFPTSPSLASLSRLFFGKTLKPNPIYLLTYWKIRVKSPVVGLKCSIETLSWNLCWP